MGQVIFSILRVVLHAIFVGSEREKRAERGGQHASPAPSSRGATASSPSGSSTDATLRRVMAPEPIVRHVDSMPRARFRGAPEHQGPTA